MSSKHCKTREPEEDSKVQHCATLSFDFKSFSIPSAPRTTKYYFF